MFRTTLVTFAWIGLVVVAVWAAARLAPVVQSMIIETDPRLEGPSVAVPDPVERLRQ